MLRIIVLVLCASLLSGCYYVQAAQGQWELTRKREPIDEVLAREDTSDDLAARLQLVKEARQFAVDELGLPDNDTYRTYADLQREFVVWNVFAAPEFSLEPKTWCYPIVGCVSYRGYFRKADAERQADRLRSKGYDVAVGGVAAYSTLGKLRDLVRTTEWEKYPVEIDERRAEGEVRYNIRVTMGDEKRTVIRNATSAANDPALKSLLAVLKKVDGLAEE